jgi:acetyl-CoA carboxylase biotin carboxyl carrier protein
VTSQIDQPDNDDRLEISEIKEVTAVVQELIAMMGDGNIRSLRLHFGELRLNLEAGMTSTEHNESIALQAFPTRQQPAATIEPEDDSGLHIVAAPMIGTFYVAPAPNEPAFVSPGDTVEEGQTIGIIEAMKIMNEIATDRAGTVVEVIAGDGQTVEYGSPLLCIKSAEE